MEFERNGVTGLVAGNLFLVGFFWIFFCFGECLRGEICNRVFGSGLAGFLGCDFLGFSAEYQSVHYYFSTVSSSHAHFQKRKRK